MSAPFIKMGSCVRIELDDCINNMLAHDEKAEHVRAQMLASILLITDLIKSKLMMIENGRKRTGL